MDLIQRARAYAIAAHTATAQIRKYTHAPYWHHCQEVASTVARYAADPAIVATAWLHDVVEDTSVTIEDLRKEFPERAVELVWWLTDASIGVNGNRAFRKALDRQKLSFAPPEAALIKLADALSNTRDIAEHDPKFAVTYANEKLLLLDEMRSGPLDLRTQLVDQIQHILEKTT